VGAGVLGEVVAAGELLTALVALERLVLGVQGAVVALEVLLATETARAQGANESLGRVIRQRLLTAATVNGDRGGLGVGARGAYRLGTALGVGHGNPLDGLLLILHLHIGVLPRRFATAALLGLDLFLLDNFLGLLDLGLSRLGPLERGKAVVQETLVVVGILQAVLAQKSIILDNVLVHTLALAAQVDSVGARVELDQAVQLIVGIKVREAVESRQGAQRILGGSGE
jgi:hypothetical protein